MMVYRPRVQKSLLAAEVGAVTGLLFISPLLAIVPGLIPPDR